MSKPRMYRGKRKDNGEWVKGWYRYCPGNQEHSIHVWHKPEPPVKYGHWTIHNVIPETVGQSTGKFDKRDDEIFEGMQVKIGGQIFTVKWSKSFCAWRLDDWASLATYNKNAIEIIHDNPEILK